MANRRRKPKVARKRRGAKDQNILTPLSVFAITQNEYFKQLKNIAGFSDETALRMIMDPDNMAMVMNMPNWLVPNPADGQIPIYEDPDDDGDED